MTLRLIACFCFALSLLRAEPAPPAPVGPVPSARQLAWQQMEYYAFVHLSLNTYTDQSWGFGNEDPRLFNPVALDCRAWARLCRDAGMKGIILTAKHHGGFCLWPSKFTDYSVKNSPWKNGQGDLVREVSDACREYGLKFGVYLSPWDRNRADYGRPEYLDYFRNQLTELLTQYGPVFEVWFDGANGGSGHYGGANETRTIDRTTYYDWPRTYALVRSLQPEIVIWNDGGDRADLRWVGTEEGYVGETNWSLLNAAGEVEWGMLHHGLETGDSWVPAEVNTSVRPEWFYHPAEDEKVKTVPDLMETYYNSIGRNATLLLNFPIMPDGRVHPRDEQAVLGLAATLKASFADNLAAKARVWATNVRGGAGRFAPENVTDENPDTYWATEDGVTSAALTLELDAPALFNRFLVQEHIALGQRVRAFTLEALVNDAWRELARGTTIGYKRILCFPTTQAAKLRLTITGAKACPLISQIGLYCAPVVLAAPSITRNQSGLVSLSTRDAGPVFHYTLDGSEPTTASPRYEAPFKADGPVQVNALAVDAASGRSSEVSRRLFGLSKLRWSLPGIAEAKAASLFDGDPSTAWHHEGGLPSELVIDLGCAETLAGLRYLPEQGRWASGRIARFELQVSNDGVCWEVVDKGEFANIRNNPVWQTRSFGPVRARYVKVTALSLADDGAKPGYAELELLAPATQTPGTRLVMKLDEGWRFHAGEAPEAVFRSFDDSLWRSVDLPHDYVVEGVFAEKNTDPRPEALKPDWHWLHGFLPTQPAVYRKTFELPADCAGRRVWLEFDGVCNNSLFWFNGVLLAHQFSGYTRTRLDVTRLAAPGAGNLIVVQVDPRYEGWWYEGGGIYRHVRLVVTDSLHVEPDGVFVTPRLEDPCGRDEAPAELAISVKLANDTGAPVMATVLNEVLGEGGRVLASERSELSLGEGARAELCQSLALADARLWSVERPHLYVLRTTVSGQGKAADVVHTPFGVRHLRFDAERGFFLNGRRVQLKGVNMHQDHAGVGVAMPDRLFTWRLERLKEMGCNAIRMSHNPVAPFLLDECDRLGFLVVAENRHFGDVYRDQAPEDAPASELSDLASLVLRDRNHPSIILWSIANEQWIGGTPGAARIARAMRERVRQLDPSRPVTAAMNGGFDSSAGMIGELDVVGINYNPWAYEPVHRRFPGIPMIASEIASEISTRGVYALEKWDDYHGDRAKGHVAAYSISAGPAGQTVENAWPPVVERPHIAGAFVWAAFDYKGEPRPFGWPVVNCHYGFMDLCGFPKDSYYYYKAWWTQEPVLHLFPHWNWQGREGEAIPVWVHSNCEEVELFLNGVSLGVKQTTPLRHLEWSVPYAPGRLEARGRHRGVLVEASRETTGLPASLRLSADRLELSADNADLAVVKIEVLDAQGRLVPDAKDKIVFTLTGPAKLIGVGNGDPSCHEPDKGDRRSAFNGLAQALVQTTRTGGEIELRAEAPGLEGASLRLRSR